MAAVNDTSGVSPACARSTNVITPKNVPRNSNGPECFPGRSQIARCETVIYAAITGARDRLLPLMGRQQMQRPGVVIMNTLGIP